MDGSAPQVDRSTGPGSSAQPTAVQPGRLTVGHLVILVAGAVEEAVERAADLLGFAALDLNALYLLTVHGPQTAGGLASMLRVRPASVTALALRLEPGGLLVRRRDGNDRRRVWQCVTPTGKGLVDAAAVTVKPEVDALFAPLGEGPTAALRELLATVASARSGTTPEREGDAP